MERISDDSAYVGPERRSQQVIRIELTEEQLDHIVDKVYDKLYIQIGKNVVRQCLFLLGTSVLAASAYFGLFKGH